MRDARIVSMAATSTGRPRCGAGLFQDVAGIAVGDRGQDRAPGGDVLVGLPRDEPGADARWEVVHWEKEEIGRPQERHRVVVPDVAEEPHVGQPRHDRTVGLVLDTREVELDEIAPFGPRAQELLQGLDQIDVRAGDDPHAVPLTAEKTSRARRSQLPLSQRRVEIAGVHDPELAVRTLRPGTGEVSPFPAVRTYSDRVRP